VTSDLPSVSVIIPCYRHAEALVECLMGLAAQKCAAEWEVLVVSSGADPESACAARQQGARLVECEARLLPGQARNLGATHARGRVLAFIDADCVPESEWLEAALAGLHTGARLVSGPVLDARPLNPIAVSDNLLQFADFPPNRPDGPARYFAGCNLAIRHADFDALGGFPEVALPAGEDTSFSAAASSRWPDGLHYGRGMRVRHGGRTTFKAYLEHHASFGYCRAALDLHLAPWQRKWGAHRFMGPAVALKRLLYILGRGLQWDRSQLARTLVLLPIVLSGLFAWTSGFQRGLRSSVGHKP
jgi:glycosyltransferase involved in cell wall biosynthesis